MRPSSAPPELRGWSLLAILWLIVAPTVHAEPASACARLAAMMAQQGGTAVFLPSYPDAPRGPLRDTAFLYDNAAAAIALMGCGRPDQAHRISEAILLALDHDRHWHDGRLRNAYAAGAVTTAPLKLSGWWDDGGKRWLEDDYQVGSDGGNLAWAMLALLTLHEDRYARGAVRIAHWLERLRDQRGAGGFSGGSFGSDAAPRQQLWKSTEHNVDLAAAFTQLAASRHDVHWLEQSAVAASFVDAMWDPLRGAFAAGTAEDGVTRNPLLALDAQVWPLMALPAAVARHGEVLTHALPLLRAGPDATSGYAYSEAGGGLWTEGTAQVLLLARLRGEGNLGVLRAAIERARAADGGYFATPVAALPTGFMLETDPKRPRTYLHLEHLGALAWVALSEQGFDPFTGERALPH